MKRHPAKKRRKSDATAAGIRELTHYVRGMRKMLERMMDQVRALPPGRWATYQELDALAGRRRRPTAAGAPHGRRTH